MFAKLGLLGFAMAAVTILVPPETYAARVDYHYRPGYRYGYWRHGHYHPYQHGYYDRSGRWRRY